MAEGTYEGACMRAELLGLEKPRREEFVQPSRQLDDENEQVEAAQFEDISLQNDDLRQTTGGLNELNNILSGTQRKLNRLKGVCGSLTDLLRNKLGGSKDNMSYSTDPSYLPADGVGSSRPPAGNINQALDDLDTMKDNQRQGVGRDINQQITSQVDKLDALLSKADNAQMAMDHQNKQMKKMIK